MNASRLLKHARYWLKAQFDWVQVPIKAGPLAGYRWSVFTGVRFIRGEYHAGEVRELVSLMKPGEVFYDVGAHIGYYALIAAQELGPSGKVIAFEPLPLNLHFLRRHIAVNQVHNVEVLAMGLSDHAGEARFDVAGGTGRGRLGSTGDVAIEIESIDTLCASGRIPPPNLIKMDIEGAEYQALVGARETLARHRPVVFLATHGSEVRAQCEALLTGLGYTLRPFRGSDIIATPGSPPR